ncbi:hypothetical protein MTR67_036944 [Solanum verrucosum]|uniref:Uncharacterized protein n=1 Tax=Solanum verrucosum TaxID=315347 RepID=A0AAF0UDP6_SOLVR|nr:hypothetical protein MTR67_036944 [Solanum verrucosum]
MLVAARDLKCPNNSCFNYASMMSVLVHLVGEYQATRSCSLCANFPPEKMLMFASQVAAIGCSALGARAGLPHLTDPRFSPFLA